MNKELKKFNSAKIVRGELTVKILEFLSDTASALDEILYPFLECRYRRGGISKEELAIYFERRRAEEREIQRLDFVLKEKRRITALIQRLQKAGLVKNEGGSKKALWAITQKGLDKIFRLKERILKSKNKPLLPSKTYFIKPSKQTIIVSFDIEELRKEKRAWLRDVLKNLDYKILQRSVWIGINQLPKKLIEDLKKLDILKNIKIFSVAEKGNIFEE